MGILKDDDIPKKEQRKFLNFQLTGLSPQSPWFNKTFKSLDEVDQRRLKKATLNIVNITLTDDVGLKGVYHIFERLNTGGTKLSAQEIRNCVFSGKFNNFLLELNTNENWRHFITVDTEKSHQKDVELILRFFALYDDLLSYKKPMKTFLSEYMRKKSNISEDELQTKRKLFQDVTSAIYKNLGINPFHIRNQINSAVCDSVMVAFAKNLNNIPDDIKRRYDSLTQHNDEYYTYVSKSSNDSKSVYNRIQMTEKYLFPPKEINDEDKKNKNKIKLYSVPVCAGSGFYIDDSSEYIDFFTEEIKADYAVKVNGDSMSPRINGDDILLIQKTTKPKNGDLIIATYQNETICKKNYIFRKMYLSKTY